MESLSSFFQSSASLKSDEPSVSSSSSPSPATANATATGSDETAAARASPAFERPYPCFRTGADGAKRRDEHADTPEVATHVTASETTEAEATSNAGREANDVERREAPTLDTYPPSPRRDAASRDGETVTRSGHSAPEASTLSAVAATFSPAVASEAAKTVAPGGAGEDSSTASGEGARAASPTYQTAAGDVVLNKYHPSKKREARSNHPTTEAEVSSLVAHCVRHTEKAAPGVAATPSGGVDTLPEGIKDVLRRLTRETFSDNTTLVTIERVRGIGGNHGGEARHNSQMMVVSKLLNDLATRRHRAMTSSAA